MNFYLIILVDFCENPEVGIKDPDEIQECKDEMAEFIPEVLQVIFTNLEENSQNTCYDAFEVCDENPKAIKENGCADCVYTISELFSTLVRLMCLSCWPTGFINRISQQGFSTEFLN